jgi:hypothetical protein
MAQRDVSGSRRQCVRIEFKSKAVVHFDLHQSIALGVLRLPITVPYTPWQFMR